MLRCVLAGFLSAVMGNGTSPQPQQESSVRSGRSKPSSEAELEPSEARGTWKDRVQMQMRLLHLLLTSQQYQTLSKSITPAIPFLTITDLPRLRAQTA
ncbi:hypothetical protein KC360_g207 [Hortaea werneckii]|nr:hypothetical protein KC344_g211 [Hortaea werneckii]KAI7180542.1 hypothetical protein KC360_g207 [Hortaea werneckii]